MLKKLISLAIIFSIFSFGLVRAMEPDDEVKRHSHVRLSKNSDETTEEGQNLRQDLRTIESQKQPLSQEKQKQETFNHLWQEMRQREAIQQEKAEAAYQHGVKLANLKHVEEDNRDQENLRRQKEEKSSEEDDEKPLLLKNINSLTDCTFRESIHMRRNDKDPISLESRIYLILSVSDLATF